MDYYELLGVRKSASASDLRRAYQKLARRLHPDLNPGDPVAAERFAAVTRAFETLSDPQRRAAYDRGERPTAAPPAVAAVGFEGFDFSVGMRGRGAGFRELFDSVLRPFADAAGQAPPRGEDLEQRTRISFEEGLSGATRRLHIAREERCRTCDGAGEVNQAPVPCAKCRGTGEVRAKRGHMIFTRACSECGATGLITRQACPLCLGEGRLMHSEWLEVQVPPGVPDGARLRIPEAGNAGRRGGPAGDLVLVVEVEGHSFYRREGDDLVCEVPVTLAEAALGAHVEVPTPDGPMTIEVPAGTQTGQRFRLRKRGAPRMDGSRSDLYVEARVVIPAVTDARGRELIGELARRDNLDPRRELLAAAGEEELMARKRRARGEEAASPRAASPGGKFYMISVVAKSYDIHPQTLRLYEREGLLKPSRTDGNTRLYSEDDLKELEVILNLTRDLGVNLAGVEIVLNMRRKMEEMRSEMSEFVAWVKDELVRANREGWQERFEQALVKLPPTQIVRSPAPPSS